MKKQNNTTIKANLTRSALYLLLLLAVCAIPFALAQRNATHRTVAPMNNATADLNSATGVDQAQPPLASGGSELAPLGIPAYPKAPQVVLYDQYDNASVIGTLSATFTDFSPFNSDLADDFVVPTGQTWNVQSIDADGCTWVLALPTVSMCSSMPTMRGLPGALVYSATNQPFSVVGSNFFSHPT